MGTECIYNDMMTDYCMNATKQAELCRFQLGLTADAMRNCSQLAAPVIIHRADTGGAN